MKSRYFKDRGVKGKWF